MGFAAVALASGVLARADAGAEPVAGLGVYKKLSLAQLMDLEVTSVSRRPEMLSDAASAVQVVTGEDIRRAGATRLPLALRLLANLEVAQIDSRQWAIAARGFNNTSTNKLLVQMDGRTLYTPLYAGVFWDVQDTLIEDVDRIEAISGPGATQWGSNAVNGVINIVTKSARETQGGLVTGTAGTELRSLGAVRYGGTIAPGLYYRVYGKQTEHDSSILSNGQSAGDEWHMTQGGFRMDWEGSSADRATLQGDAYRGRFGQTTLADGEASGANLLARWTRTFAPKSELTVQAYHDYTHRGLPGSFFEHLHTYDLDVQHRWPLGEDHDLIWGGAYRSIDDRVSSGSTLVFRPENVKREWLSGFVQDELGLIDGRLRITAGIKVEHNPYTGSEFQPSVRAGWKLTKQQLLWAAVSRALRSPSRIDRELFVPANPPYVIAGGPDFQSERLIAYELGYRAEPHPRLTVSLATFFHDYDDLRSIEPPATPGAPSLLANGLEGKSYGAEWSADYRVGDSWRLRFGYTEQRVISRPKSGSKDIFSVRSQALDPNRTAVLTSQMDLPAHTSLDVTARYVGQVSNQDVPAYLGLDVRFGWRPVENLELAVTARNLADSAHPEFGTAISRREIERGVNGSLTWRF